jgi:hypothetical protein
MPYTETGPEGQPAARFRDPEPEKPVIDQDIYDTSAAEAIARGRPWAYWVPAEPWKDTGKWVPSVIVEGVPGHTPMAGNGECAQPWYWGDSYLEAKATCDQVNAELGVTEAEMVRILFSSLRAQRAASQGRV